MLSHPRGREFPVCEKNRIPQRKPPIPHAVCPELALYVRKNGRSGNRLGLTVSTKVGCAVVRNRVRRRLREIYRLNEDMLTSGVDIVVVARVRAAHVPYRRLEQAFLKLCAKVDMLAK